MEDPIQQQQQQQQQLQQPQPPQPPQPQLRTTTAANSEAVKTDSCLQTNVENCSSVEAAQEVEEASNADVNVEQAEQAEQKKIHTPLAPLLAPLLAPMITVEKATALVGDSRRPSEDLTQDLTEDLTETNANEAAESTEPEHGQDPPAAESRDENVSVKVVNRTIECSKCHATESLFWRTSTGGALLCVACQGSTEIEAKEYADEELSQAGSDPPTTPSGSDHNEEAEYLADQDDVPQKAPSPRKRELRKATRLKTAKYVKSANKSRRSLMFKKSAPTKTTSSVSHFITTNYVRHKGSYLQRGDIVSMLGDDSEIYYAQLRTFLVDQFGELSATISWLIPTERSPTDGSFDPATFVIGPEEDFPRDLRSMSFECHAPSDYYLARDRPILFDERKGCKAFVWTTLGRPKAIYDTSEAQ